MHIKINRANVLDTLRVHAQEGLCDWSCQITFKEYNASSLQIYNIPQNF